MAEPTTYLAADDAADFLNVTTRTLQRWRCDGIGPAFTRLGKRRIGYSVDVLREWAERRTYRSRAAEMASTTPQPGA